MTLNLSNRRVLTCLFQPVVHSDKIFFVMSIFVSAWQVQFYRNIREALPNGYRCFTLDPEYCVVTCWVRVRKLKGQLCLPHTTSTIYCIGSIGVLPFHAQMLHQFVHFLLPSVELGILCKR